MYTPSVLFTFVSRGEDFGFVRESGLDSRQAEFAMQVACCEGAVGSEIGHRCRYEEMLGSEGILLREPRNY